MKKSITWLHLSDIHFNFNSDWSDGASRHDLLDYLKGLFNENSRLRPDLIFCTGDIAFGETSSSSLEEQYEHARTFFKELLGICGDVGHPLSIERMFIVPGNHDINRSSINLDAQNTMIDWSKSSKKHVDKVNQRFNDKSIEFKDAIKRMSEYDEFVKEFLPHQYDDNGRQHFATTQNINGKKIGISGFNSAWSCSGPEDDRSIWIAAEWQLNKSKEILKDADIKIGLIHHPIDWLNTAEMDICNKRIPSEFDFWLHGHTHNAWVSPYQTHVVIAAGAVCSAENEEFGVNLTSIDFQTAKGVVNLYNRAGNGWAIAPVSQHAPNGMWNFNLPLQISDENKLSGNSKEGGNSSVASGGGLVVNHLTKKLNDALKSFDSQPVVWVSPVLRSAPETENNSKESQKVNLDDLLSGETSLIIKAPPQYGLTCLSHYLILEARKTNNAFWLYLDAKLLKPNTASIQNHIDAELALIGSLEEDIECVVIDSWKSSHKDAFKLLKAVKKKFPDTRIICMQTIDGAGFQDEKAPEFEFEVLYIWSLNRIQIRELVAEYNEKKIIGDDDLVTKRIVNDLDVLNLHRTPMNCLTLLKASEVDFDENPVNRSEMIKRVLFLLFNVDAIPTYKLKPDLKDCEYVIGNFCEKLMRKGSYSFTRDRFLLDAQNCCKNSLIDLEVHMVFDVLYNNHILIKTGTEFSFRFAYWIFYFAAQRMHHSEEFREFIFDEYRYLQYPELVEFYTGIDRSREDAILHLTKDLKFFSEEVKKNCGFPLDFNPYQFATWKATPKGVQKMEKELADGISESNLPAEIKDKYADRDYDHSKPYDQSINKLIYNQSFYLMLKAMKASARALRNSDYVNVEYKKELLKEILISWEQATRVLLVVLPMLAEKGFAQYDGMGIVLVSSFGEGEKKEKFIRILEAIPANVASWASEDLFSPKIGPLLFNLFDNKDISEISKHELAWFLIEHRPRNWKKHIHDYIASISHNSFYLLDVDRKLRQEYQYSYASKNALDDMEYLLKLVGAKHLTGEKMPSNKTMKKVTFGSEFIPERDAPD